jgi:hypothetical protein
LTPRNKKLLLVGVAIVAIGLNVVTFALALPAMFQTDTYQTVQSIPPFIYLHSGFPPTETPYLARDFSAYYIAAWKLIHAPTRIYSQAVDPGDYTIYPRPALYKYAPSFLLFIVPFLLLGYQTALVEFNLIQLCLLPLMALITYRLMRDRHPLLASGILVIVLLQPLPPTYSPLLFRFAPLQPDAISWSYFYNWINGEAKVLQTFLLLAALYFGKTGKPWPSALFLALGAFDPRFALLALPLLVWYNRAALRAFAAGSLLFLVAANAIGLYQGIFTQFVQEAVTKGATTPLYPYAWIPLYGIAAISLVEFGSLISEKLAERRGLRS